MNLQLFAVGIITTSPQIRLKLWTPHFSVQESYGLSLLARLPKFLTRFFTRQMTKT
jgi:hypothetical protein